ncbi:histidine kinase [Kribbella sp. NPDC003505]|uniref:sensor histidine kinase n=1 Tax=Kribbella sp. NPDC003505 TaxID=3154448 RepID=UPI0033B39C5B
MDGLVVAAERWLASAKRWLASLVSPELRLQDREVDVLLVIAVSVASAVAFIAPAPGSVTALGVILNLGTIVPLLWRRRAPFVVMVLVGMSATGVSIYHRPGQSLQYGGLLAIYTLASRGQKRWQRVGLLVVILVSFPPASLLLKHNNLDEFMFTVLLPVAAYLLGSLERSRREHAQFLEDRARQLQRERRAEAARAAAEERARVARDMHDILAHAVSMMVVQAEAGPIAARIAPEQAEQVFEAIADAGRDAMVQLRRLLGVLKSDEQLRGPQPTLAGLSDLVGTTASLDVTGMVRPIPADTEVAVYRIVQEALTNTVKHARAQQVRVQLKWCPQELVVSVTDDGQGPLATINEGYGLIGIRERAAACSGTAEVGPRVDGGFEVRARLPYGEGIR